MMEDTFINRIRYAFRWLAAHICFWLGDLISKLPGGWWYPAYNWLMITSCDLDHDDLDMWYPADSDEVAIRASNQEH